MLLQRHSLIYTLGVFIILGSFGLVLAGLLELTSGVTYTASASPHVVWSHHRSVLLTSGTLNDCPDAPPLNAQATPLLHFCSPKFAGDVSGPFGSHIVILGQNFPSLPTSLYIAINKNLSQGCTLDTSTDCFTLTLPTNFSKVANPQQFVLKFSWVFHISSGLPADFYLAAIYKKVGGKVATAISTLAFTLLSSGPPCITVTSTKVNVNSPQFTNTSTPIPTSASTGCDSVQSTSIQAGSSAFIQGYNWLPGGQNQQRVRVTATCISSSCSPLQLFTAQPDASGFFQQQISLPSNAAEKYQITAGNQVIEVAMPGGVTNTVGSNALTFGHKDLADTTALTLTLSRGGGGGPQFAIDLSMVSLILIVVAFLIYLSMLLRPARAATGSSSDSEAATGPSLASPKPSHVYYLPRTRPRNFLATQSQQLLPGNSKINQGDLNRIKEAKAALEKGISTPAIDLAVEAQRSNPALWQPLLDAVTEASVVFTPHILLQIKKYASDNLDWAIAAQDGETALRHYCAAFIYYKCALNATDSEKNALEAANIYYNKGIIYNSLPVISLANLEAAIACFELARQFYNKVDNRPAYAATLYNLGNLYSDLPGGDRQLNLELAINYYKDALDIYQTSEEYTVPGAITSHHLGNAYQMLPGEARKRQANLFAAIMRYNYAHSAYTKMQMYNQVQEVQASIAQTQALLQNIGQG